MTKAAQMVMLRIFEQRTARAAASLKAADGRLPLEVHKRVRQINVAIVKVQRRQPDRGQDRLHLPKVSARIKAGRCGKFLDRTLGQRSG
mmetsp:Transcript_33161/g.61008  ORF Transcript_33161/g.61008 Transcript_33161/m.61008 type:complete len:89 (+) Transcript_33161:191-457(+)